MTLAKRLDAIEDHSLTPKEAVIAWMRSAHEFGSHEAYARWLLEQPDEAYPLIRMPAQVVGAVRARSKGVPDAKLRSQFYEVQKEVLFLYHLHKLIAMRALMENEAIHLRVVILVRDIRALVSEKHRLAEMRLERVDLESGKHKRPGKAEKADRTRYEEQAAAWLPEAMELLGRVLAYLEAARIISRTYLAGEDLLYPQAREYLGEVLQTIISLREMYVDAILETPDTDDHFRDYLVAMLEGKGANATPDLSPVAADLPDVSAPARRLAEQWVLLARSEALKMLGEDRAAEALAEKVLRMAV